MKQYPKHFKIEFKTKPAIVKRYRAVYYRIVPDQLNLWDRIFNNRWRKLWKTSTYDGSIIEIFEPSDFMDYFKLRTTVEDINEYINQQNKKAEEVKERERKARYDRYLHGEIWEDEI